MKRASALLAAALLAALAIAAPAAASEAAELDAAEGFSILQEPCVDGEGGEVTITTTRSYAVSSGRQTAGLSVRVGDDVIAYTEPKDAADGTYENVDFSLTVGPFASDTTVLYRWFNGPDRNDDPLWDATGPGDGQAWTDAVDFIVALEDAEERYWDARDDGPFVNWHEVEVKGCAKPEPSETATTTTTTTTEAAKLANTGVNVTGIALVAIGLVVVGAVAVGFARRRRT